MSFYIQNPFVSMTLEKHACTDDSVPISNGLGTRRQTKLKKK